MEGKPKGISPYIRLFRIEHALMLAVAVLLSELLVGKALSISLPPISIVVLSLLVPVFVEMGSFALNDYLDVKADRANRRRDRPIVAGEISPQSALGLAALCYAIGILACIPLPREASMVALVFIFLSVLYNWQLKRLPLIGNLYIAASMAIPFIFGNIVVSPHIMPSIILITMVAFLSGVGREILKSAEDLEGDVKHRGASTLPAVIGIRNSSYIGAVCYLISAPLSFAPFLFGLPQNILSLGLVGVSALAFLFLACKAATDHTKAGLESSRKSSLAALAAGLAGYAASLL